MAMSLLAGGKQVPARLRAAPHALAEPAAKAIEPTKPIEIATPAWLEPILAKLAEKPEEKEDDDSELMAAIEKLRQEVGPITALKAEVARQTERADQLEKMVESLKAQLRAVPAPAQPAQPAQDWDIVVERGADNLMKRLKVVRT